MNNDFSNPGYNIDNFKVEITIIIEFQILLPNFKASKKIDAVKVYLFQLLKVYLVNNPIH